MIIKRTIAAATFATIASVASSTELPLVDPISAKIFLELHSIQKLSADIRPLVSAPGEAFRIIDGDFLALGNLRIRLPQKASPQNPCRNGLQKQIQRQIIIRKTVILVLL